MVGVYAEEYLGVLNSHLKTHPGYRADMKFTAVFAQGGLVTNTRDRVQTPDDARVFDETFSRVTQEYRLIVL